MTDRELLELAAKAAGIDAEFHPDLGYSVEGMWLKGVRSPDNSKYWNPLTTDGDALRLAVALQTAKGASWVICLSIGDNRTACEFHYACGPDTAANVRRAIVIAAAEHGKAMP